MAQAIDNQNGAPVSTLRPRIAGPRWGGRFLGLLTIAALATGVCTAETIRVTSWNLEMESENEGTPSAIEEAAATLKALNPDVILLQEVKDWRMCDRLAAALRPLEYHVLICSAFHGISGGAAGQPQVAVFSKAKAYFTWADGWTASKQQGIAHGVGFAAIQAGNQRLGFFTAVFGNQQTGEQLARRLLEQIDSVNHWETNQIQTFVIAASSGLSARNPPRVLRRASAAFEKSALIDATANLPAEVRSTLRTSVGPTRMVGDCLFAGPKGVPSNTRVTVSQVSGHYPVTTDIELDAAKVSLALDIRAEELRQRRAHNSLVIRNGLCATGGVIVLGLVTILVVRSRRKRAVQSLSPATVNLPLRVSPKPSPPQVRPVIIAERPSPTTSTDDSSPLRRMPLRPVLRLQNPRSNGPTQQGDTPQSSSPPADTRLPAKPEEDSKDGPVALMDPVPVQTQTHQLSRDPEVREGVIKELSGWLKQRLVGKLVTDRAQLIQAQQLATRMASTLDDRLARIEGQIQQQNQAYILRIEELNRELAAAREENRELIRERIAQVKAEMEAARAKVLAEADFDASKLRL